MTELLISLIMLSAPHFNINPSVAVAVAQHESELNPLAIGPVGEVGLFQVRPEYSKYTTDELKNPSINITEGLRILSESKRRCKHREDRTWLVCYNAGLTGGARIRRPRKFPYYIKVMNRIADVQAH